MTAFCELDDVRSVLQKRDLNTETGTADDGPLATDIVQDAIESASDWFARATNGHWYDSGGGTEQDLVDTAAATASSVSLSLPSSPHRQRGTLFTDRTDAQYPVTVAGPYARVQLPHPYVQNLTGLVVRDRAGGTSDWVADTEITEGRGDDYYLSAPGQNSYGKRYLYIQAASIGAREDFGHLLSLDYEYGLDAQTETWDDVRRGVAQLAAAELIDEDNVITQIPENARLAGVETQHQQLLDAAAKRLDPYAGGTVA